MITKEEIQKVLQKAAKKTLKNDGVHIEIVFEKQAEAIVKLFALPVVSACKTMAFSVGDKAIITCEKNRHEFKIGEQVYVTEVDSALEDYAVTNNKKTWQVTDEEIKKCE